MSHSACRRYTILVMKRLLTPWALANSAARHLAWYLSYQVTGETRTAR